jgi:hypothetical protein
LLTISLNHEALMNTFQVEINRVRDEIRKGKLINEAAVTQGAILPILAALNWPIFDTSVVSPQHSIEGKRGDLALRDTRGRTSVLIEAKAIGKTEGADRQLFEYAFHQGIQGNYQERRLHKIDLLERNPEVSSQLLERYLLYERVLSGEALDDARKDYKDVDRQRTADANLPQAWKMLLNDQDEILIDLLGEKVEDLCGFKPSKDACLRFIQSVTRTQNSSSPVQSMAIPKAVRLIPEPSTRVASRPEISFNLKSVHYPAQSAREAMIILFRKLAEIDPTFLERFASRKHGRKRRYLAQIKTDLYPDRPDLAEDESVEVLPGWWMSTNHSRHTIDTIIRMAVEVAGLQVGKDFSYSLGQFE